MKFDTVEAHLVNLILYVGKHYMWQARNGPVKFVSLRRTDLVSDTAVLKIIESFNQFMRTQMV